MLVSKYIQLAYQNAVGEAEPPAVGTENYKLLFNSGVQFIETWQDEPNTNWGSLWNQVTLATPITAVNSFVFDQTVVRKVSREENGVIVTALNGSKAYYTVVKPSELHKGGNRVAQSGNRLLFAEPFAANSPFIGGSITMSFFGYAPTLIDQNSIIPVDQPMWLVFMGAADFARNDYTKQNQSAGLVAQAQDIMKSMKINNEEEQDPTMSHGDYSPLGETT